MTAHSELTLLITDDDDGHALLIQEALEESGLTNPMHRFHDGEDVWAFLTDRNGDPSFDPSRSYLLLLDIRMPRMDGVEVLRRIKADPALCSLPVIMLTTTDDPREVAECYCLGCNSYVTKPVRFEDFTEALKRLGLFLSVIAVAPPGVSICRQHP